MIVADKNGVQVLSEPDHEGRSVYTVTFRNEPRCKTGDQSEAMDEFKALQPLKVVCDKCKAMDVLVFFGRLGVGRLQVAGEGGWRMERFFGGMWDHRDVALCPECAAKLDAEMSAYLAKKGKR